MTHEYDGRKYSDSDELCEYIAYKSNYIGLLNYSTGKDSIASLIQMKRYFKKIILLYFYQIPNAEYNRAYLERLKKRLAQENVSFYSFPSPRLTNNMNKGLFQTKESLEIIRRINYPTINYDGYSDLVKMSLDLPESTFKGVGVREADSPMRGMAIRKYGAVREKNNIFFPVYDWKIERIKREIEEAEFEPPPDYKIWGRTFDGLDYRFTMPLKEHFPEDYEKLKLFFPLHEVEHFRYGKEER